MTTLKITKDLITMLGIGIASFVAISGLSAWKKQMKGKTDYEVARRCLKSVYKLREAIKYVRNPYISVGEMEKSLEESGLKDNKDLTKNQKTNWAVYDARWKKVSEAKTEMDIEFFEAEVSWGKDIILTQKDFKDLIGKLYGTVSMFLMGYGKEKHDEIIYDTGEEDVFTKEVDEAIEKIEDYLKFYLR
ncbi:MAG: hypothetical protein WC662_01580 [Candidatus Paceibacterota bacterium]|jgi:hypothetical protein